MKGHERPCRTLKMGFWGFIKKFWWVICQDFLLPVFSGAYVGPVANVISDNPQACICDLIQVFVVLYELDQDSIGRSGREGGQVIHTGRHRWDVVGCLSVQFDTICSAAARPSVRSYISTTGIFCICHIFQVLFFFGSHLSFFFENSHTTTPVIIFVATFPFHQACLERLVEVPILEIARKSTTSCTTKSLGAAWLRRLKASGRLVSWLDIFFVWIRHFVGRQRFWIADP